MSANILVYTLRLVLDLLLSWSSKLWSCGYSVLSRWDFRPGGGFWHYAEADTKLIYYLLRPRENCMSEWPLPFSDPQCPFSKPLLPVEFLIVSQGMLSAITFLDSSVFVVKVYLYWRELSAPFFKCTVPSLVECGDGLCSAWCICGWIHIQTSICLSECCVTSIPEIPYF